MGKIISFINQKGGCGKTTSSVAVSYALQEKYRVLAIDLDAQCNLSSSMCVQNKEVNTYSVLKGEKPFRTIKVTSNLEVLPASLDLSSFSLEMSQEPGKEYLLSEALEPVKDNYDFIILDCSPNLGLLSLNALTASDFYIIPLLPHHLNIQGLTILHEVAEKVKRRINPNLELAGILLNQFSPHKVLHRDIRSVLEKHFGDKLFKTYIRENIALAEAPSTGKSIFTYAPNSNGAKDYLNFASELVTRLKR